MIFEQVPTLISDCWELRYNCRKDSRGHFVKTFHFGEFSIAGLETNFTEEYYTVSHQRVLRGLHFQIPPMDYVKLVYVIVGSIMDVVVDLRVGSPSYGLYNILKLSANLANALYIPKGIAHGFYALEREVVTVYKVSNMYSADHDHGILWNSAGIPWPDMKPILSERDNCFPAFSEFDNPFQYAPNNLISNVSDSLEKVQF